MTLPYPGRNESFDSWDRRCKEYERDQARWRKEQADRSANWGGYNYRPVQANVDYVTPAGERLTAIKVNCSRSRGGMIRRFAVKHGLAFARFVWGSGMTARTDNVAFQPTEKMVERYNDDDH